MEIVWMHINKGNRVQASQTPLVMANKSQDVHRIMPKLVARNKLAGLRRNRQGEIIQSRAKSLPATTLLYGEAQAALLAMPFYKDTLNDIDKSDLQQYY